MEGFHSKNREAIDAAIETDEALLALERVVTKFDQSQKHLFLEALDAAQGVLDKQEVGLSKTEVLRTLRPTGVGAAIVMAMFIAFDPFAGAIGAAIGAIATGRPAIRHAREQKTKRSQNLRRLRAACVSNTGADVK
ncbi:MAG: hypothetical protein ABL893_10490 [Hyphomicrobium sp.]